MSFLFRVLSLILLVAVAKGGYATSFDCQKATTFVENTVCQEQTLSDLDDRLKAAFDHALLHNKDHESLKKQQLDWLKNTRNVCLDSDCLEKVYQERIAALNKSSTIASHAIATGDYVRYAKNGKPDHHSATLTILALDDNKFKLVGSSVWIKDIKTGDVHTGEVDGEFVWQTNPVQYQEESGCKFMLMFGSNALTVNNDNGQCGGMNVSFDGYYKKVK